MGLLTILLQKYSSGGEAFFVGAVSALLFSLILYVIRLIKDWFNKK